MAYIGGSETGPWLSTSDMVPSLKRGPPECYIPRYGAPQQPGTHRFGKSPIHGVRKPYTSDDRLPTCLFGEGHASSGLIARDLIELRVVAENPKP